MMQFVAKVPTIPIPFNRLLKVVALVDGGDPQVRALLDLIKAAGYEVEVGDRYDRDVAEDAGVGAYIVSSTATGSNRRANSDRPCAA